MGDGVEFCAHADYCEVACTWYIGVIGVACVCRYVGTLTCPVPSTFCKGESVSGVRFPEAPAWRTWTFTVLIAVLPALLLLLCATAAQPKGVIDRYVFRVARSCAASSCSSVCGICVVTFVSQPRCPIKCSRGRIRGWWGMAGDAVGANGVCCDVLCPCAWQMSVYTGVLYHLSLDPVDRRRPGATDHRGCHSPRQSCVCVCQ